MHILYLLHKQVHTYIKQNCSNISQAGLIISLLNIAGNSVCGSSLLTSTRLVTAAHCWFDGNNQAWQFVVVLGSQFLFSGGTRVATTNVVTHPQWTPNTLANDVAMIILPTNVQFTRKFRDDELCYAIQKTDLELYKNGHCNSIIEVPTSKSNNRYSRGHDSGENFVQNP